MFDAAKVHRDAAEEAEKQTKQKLEVTRQIALLKKLHVFHHKCLFVFEKYYMFMANVVLVTVRKKEARGRIKASNATGAAL